jgi:hypothetical protein
MRVGRSWRDNDPALHMRMQGTEIRKRSYLAEGEARLVVSVKRLGVKAPIRGGNPVRNIVIILECDFRTNFDMKIARLEREVRDRNWRPIERRITIVSIS